MTKSRIVLIIVFLCVNSILFSQEKMNFRPDFILIEKLPTASQILTLKISHCDSSLSVLGESEFLILLDKAKPIQPKSEILLNWNYSPWYSIEFTTLSGNYKLELYLGGLGTMTLPNGKKGAVMFDLTKK